MATLICKICGKTFESKGYNAKYCAECADAQKRQQDHESWLRRRNKRFETIRRETKYTANPYELENKLKTELGLSGFFFTLWKADNGTFAKRWMRAQVNASKSESDCAS